jgi:predicted membrane-bound spermidine synthase
MARSHDLGSQDTWLWRPNLIVFLSNACLMALELVIGRMAAPYVGMSLYTWTVIIGIVLAGISLGNYGGGQLADRWPCTRLLGAVLGLGGWAALGILAVDVLQPFTTMKGINPEDLPLIAALVALAIVLCFAPCLVLGAISPIVAKLAVRDLRTTGRSVGQLYAAGAMGSIVGTFATGFVLISRFGTHTIVWGVGLLFLFLSPLFLLERRWPWMLLWVFPLAGASALAWQQGWLAGPCTRETDYFCITVREEEHSGGPVRVLILDRLIHSYCSLDDPTRLLYGYEQSYAQATAYQSAHQEQKRANAPLRANVHLRALFIGGGGYTFPRYMEAVYPDSELHVIEIDPGVTEVAYDMLGLSRETEIVTYNEDARIFLERAPTGQYDLVFGDAFNDYSVPYHLTTKEFNDRVRTWLADDGYYAVNIIDGPSGNFLRAYLHTLRQTFRYVYPVFSIESWQQSSRSTIVILAGDTPLDMDMFQRTAPRLASLLLTESEIDALLAQGRTVTLTDRYAPVDQMLFSVFVDQIPR